MAEQKVELRKVRDLSENLNDTFLFIRQNLKPLMLSFLAIAGVFILAHSVLNGLYQSSISGVFRSIIMGRTSTPTGDSPFYMFNGLWFVMVLLSLTSYTAMNVVVNCYMKLYDQSNGVAPGIEEVWNEFKKYFFKVLFYSIPIALLIGIGFMFCLVPGIYLGVVFAPYATALIVDDETFGGAWDRCLAIIKNNFWPSLGIYLIVYLIALISAGIIMAVFSGITGLLSFFSTGNIISTIRITTSVLGVFSFVFYIIFYVSICLNYFNLSERHEGTGLMRKLDTLGNTGSDLNNIQEEY